MDESSTTTVEFPTLEEAERFCESVGNQGEAESIQIGSVRLSITGLEPNELMNHASRHNGRVITSSR